MSDAPPPAVGPEPPPPGVVVRLIQRYPWHLSVAILALFFALIRPVLRHEPDAPEVVFELPSYSLLDQHGEAFDNGTLAGKVWIAGFIFTSCPSVCPRLTEAMSRLHDRFDKHGIDVTLVSFTVDPEVDTPQVLRSYAEGVGADYDRWRFVTGEVAAARSLVIDGFRLPVDREPVKPDGTYDIVHSMRLAIVDGQGGVRGFYETDEMGLDEIFHRSQHVLRDARQR